MSTVSGVTACNPKFGEIRCFVDGEAHEGDSCPPECHPRQVVKKDGRIPLSEICVLKALAGQATVLDVRDPNEIAAAKGGVTIDTAVNVPINIDGLPQSARPTTLEEFKEKLGNKIPKEKPVIAHCTGGGRAQKAVQLLKELGYEAYNGGGPTEVREAIEAMRKRQEEGGTA